MFSLAVNFMPEQACSVNLDQRLVEGNQYIHRGRPLLASLAAACFGKS